MDKETNKIITEADELSNLIEGTGWAIVRKKLFDRLVDLTSINGIDITKENALQQITANKLAADILLDWFKDVEGTPEQAKSNALLMKDVHEESYLQHFE